MDGDGNGSLHRISTTHPVALTGKSFTERPACQATIPCCQHDHLLLAIEDDVAEALASARESVMRCERALACISKVRRHATALIACTDGHGQMGANSRAPKANDAHERVHLPSPVTSPGRCLTARETEVLCLIAQGSSNRQISDTLFLSVRTVERHIANIYLKLDIHTKSDATAFAHRHHII